MIVQMILTQTQMETTCNKQWFSPLHIHLTRLVLAVIQSCMDLEYHHLVECHMCSPGYLVVQCHVVD